MSDVCVNIRILFWHFQLTTYKTFRFSFNGWLWTNKRSETLLTPIKVLDFDLSRWGAEACEPQHKSYGNK